MTHRGGSDRDGREVLGHPGAQAGGPPLQSAPIGGRCLHCQNGAALGQGAEQGRGRNSGSLYELNKGALWFFPTHREALREESFSVLSLAESSVPRTVVWA